MNIAGPAGSLEALLEWQPQAQPRLTALICHPHPQFGGTMHNKVVFHAAKAATETGLPALRFNFRGVGASEGEYDKGIGERDDARAALDDLARRFPEIPLCIIGFSFGAWVGLDVGSSDPRVAALIGLGLPTVEYDFRYLRGVTKPKLLIQGTLDQYGERSTVQAVFDSLAEPKKIHWVENADHFFTGKLEEVQHVISEFLREVASGF